MLTVEIPPTERKVISYKDNTLVVEDESSDSDVVVPVIRGVGGRPVIVNPNRSPSVPPRVLVNGKPTATPIRVTGPGAGPVRPSSA